MKTRLILMFHKFALHIYIHKAADYDMVKILHFYKHNPQKKINIK